MPKSNSKQGKINYLSPKYNEGVHEGSSRFQKLKTEVLSRKPLVKKYFPAAAAVGAAGSILRYAPSKISVGDTDLSKSTVAIGTGAAGLGAAHLYDLKTRKMKTDPKSKRIAILYSGAKTGGGHEAPAKAIAAK